MERREVRHGRKQRLGCAFQPHVAIRRQISSVSTAGGTYVCHVICFHPPGPPGFGRTLPQDTFVFCVVRRDRDGDAVISGLDFSSTSTQLTSLPLSFFFFFVSVYLAICLCRGERELQKGLKCHGSGSGRRERESRAVEKERERGREVVYLALLVTLLWLLSSSHALDFLKLLHHRPPCQSWLLIGWEELFWLHEPHRGAPLAYSASKQLEFSV